MLHDVIRAQLGIHVSVIPLSHDTRYVRGLLISLSHDLRYIQG